MQNIIKPGLFGKTVHADNRRKDFDFGNEQLLFLKKKIDALFIGDSITQLWDIPAYVGNKLFIVNRAIGGDDSTYLLRRLDADCIQLRPKKCFLMIGTNDITQTEYDHWWRKKGRPVQEVFKDYKINILGIIQKCKEAAIPLLLCSIIPSDIAPPFDKQTRFEMTCAINRFLQESASQNHLAYIDYHSALCASNGQTILPGYTEDGIHPNAACYGAMAKILKEYLK